MDTEGQTAHHEPWNKGNLAFLTVFVGILSMSPPREVALLS